MRAGNPTSKSTAQMQGEDGRSSVLSTTDLDTPGFRWVSLRKILWQVSVGRLLRCTCTEANREPDGAVGIRI